MCGKIYKITNLINGKIYIGQTIQSTRERWYKHCAKYTDDAHFFMPIKQAIFKYGKENFNIKVLEICNIKDLDSRETYWIAFYDSYKIGYNCTEGGHSGKHRNKFTDLEELEICEQYKNNLSAVKIAEKYNVDKATVYNIIKRNKVSLTYSMMLSKRLDIDKFKNFLLSNPTVKEVSNEFNICRCSVYNVIKKNNIEYNFSTSVRP